MLVTAFTFALALLLAVLVYKLSKSRCTQNFPPGPNGWPVIGNLPEFWMQPLNSLIKWKKAYGNVVGLRLGTYNVVMLSGTENLKDAFSNPAFNSRPNLVPFEVFAGGKNHGKYGFTELLVSSFDDSISELLGSVTTSSFAIWDEIRKFTIKELNEIEFGKRGTEESVMWNVHYLLEYFDTQPSSMCAHEVLMVPICRYVWYMISGYWTDFYHSVLVRDEILAFERLFFQPIGSTIWMLPKLAKLFPDTTGYTKMVEQANRLYKVIQLLVDRNRSTWIEQFESNSETETIESSNIMQGFIWKMCENKQNTGSAFCGETGENQMKGTLFNLLVTGVTTLCNILNWALAYLAMYPTIQQKMYAEIVEVMGVKCDRDVKLSDMENMPYTIAFMKEVFRISSTAPFSNFHQTLEDVTFREYRIPKGTVIIGNLYGANHDEEAWGDPEVFHPERFLSASAPSYLSFSVGLRTCPGQTYARNTFFLYLVSLCQNYIVEFDNLKNTTPTPEELKNDCLVSVFRIAKFYHYIFNKRV